MKIFTSFYDKVINLSQHPKAVWWLGIVSFTESTFFIIPPDLLLAPITLTNKHKWVWFASVTTVTSVIGGVFGYLIGSYFIEFLRPIIHEWNYQNQYDIAYNWFTTYGVITILIAGFTPVPYKIFTIASGVFGFNFVLFILLSLLSRGLRFFFIAWFVYYFGDIMVDKLYRYIDLIGWLILLLITAYGFFYYKLF